jgi:FkbM family methyltransferase
MSVHSMRRTLLHHLAKTPALFTTLLRMTGRDFVEKRNFLRLLHRGDVLFDVGANIGNITLLFSDIVGPRGHVYSFEPVPPTFAYLTKRWAADGRDKNVTLNSFACSDETGNVSITVPDGDLGQSSMRTHSAGSWATAQKTETYEVPSRRLDDYAAEINLQRLDALKCDAEGAELLVLRGASGLLKRFSPLLFLEFADFWVKDFGYSADDLISFLEEHGYTDFLVECEYVPVKEIRHALALVGDDRSVNLVCVSKDDAALLR